MKYNISQKSLLTLIKSVINKNNKDDFIFKTNQEIDWNKIYSLAHLHGLSALTWEGIVTLSKEHEIQKVLKLTWILNLEEQTKRYSSFCKISDELTQLFLSKGIGVLLMKGVGFSTNYPTPNYRENGDIDIFTYSLNPTQLTDEAANILADQIIEDKGIKVKSDYYKHSSFIYKGITIENHKHFLASKSYALASNIDILLNVFFLKRDNSIFSILGERTELLNGKYVVYTPSAEFNSIFLAFHALQHLGCGLTLHHIVDWAVLLQKFGWCMPKEVTDKGFLSFAYALNQLCKEWFGIDVGTPDVSEKAEIIAEEIFHPKYDYKKVPETSLSKILIYKVKRMLHEHWLKKQFLDISLTKRIFTSIFVHLKNPKLFSD